eukprot:4591354-Pyramimonas_sp.AAC.1
METWMDVCRALWEGRGGAPAADEERDLRRRCPHEPGSPQAQQWVDKLWGDFQAAVENTLLEAAERVLEDGTAPDDSTEGAAPWVAADPWGQEIQH